jgi:hypothetical protein
MCAIVAGRVNDLDSAPLGAVERPGGSRTAIHAAGGAGAGGHTKARAGRGAAPGGFDAAPGVGNGTRGAGSARGRAPRTRDAAPGSAGEARAILPRIERGSARPWLTERSSSSAGPRTRSGIG